MASDFLTGSRADGVLEKVRPGTDAVRYHPASNAFGVISGGGTVRTFYKPDPARHGYPGNLEYFHAQ